MSTLVVPSSLNQLTMVSNINNLNSNLDFIQKQYNISIDVWNIILNHLFKNKLNSSIDWITNPKIHRDIKRCLRGSRIYGNYGRYMLQMLYPLSFNNHFMQIDGKLNSGRINIGSAIINSRKEYGNVKKFWVEYNYETTKDKLINAINLNTNGRKIKKLNSMSKPELFHTLLKLDEFKLEIDVKNSNKYITRYLA